MAAYLGKRIRLLPRFMSALFACAVLSLLVACDQQLTPEETSFYERAEQIKVGAPLETVRRQLGEPSRMLDPEARCKDNGGRKEWVYDSFEAPAGRKPLRAGSFMFCADQNGIVLAVFRIET